LSDSSASTYLGMFFLSYVIPVLTEDSMETLIGNQVPLHNVHTQLIMIHKFQDLCTQVLQTW